MNQKRNVWLPPDGDVRLVRFQSEVASAAGLDNGASLPPYLALAAPGRPDGEVRLGSWVLDGGEPVLEAWDAQGFVGVVRFSLSGPWTSDLGLLPSAPDWRWTRGLTAVLEILFPHGDSSFILWSWAFRRGWKSAPPKA